MKAHLAIACSVASILALEGLAQPTAFVPDTDPSPIEWQCVGPYGGDLRQVVVDPFDANRLYVGTGDGKVFKSVDAGQSWTLPAAGLRLPGLSVDTLLADISDHRYLFAGCWSTQVDRGGGIFRSRDEGESWSELKGISGHAVRALAQSATRPSMLVAGALDGVFLSNDWGDTWSRISPADHAEIRHVESVAIHPTHPSMIFIGTWHLPWKTLDGGKSWSRAGGRDTGMVDDSDIFSILVDASHHDRLFMSACTGLYRSDDGSRSWTKIKGIPSNSKRTRVVYQHPTRAKTLYAGTTEGLWRSTDGGSAWRLVSDRTLVVNGIAIPREALEKVYVATDQMGLLVSENGGLSYRPSNAGLANRPVATVIGDAEKGGRLYAGLLQERSHGPLWVSEDGGGTWNVSARGLRATDVYCLYQSRREPNELIAGTSAGLFRSIDRGTTWAPWGISIDAPTTRLPARPPPRSRRGSRSPGGSKSSKVHSKTARPLQQTTLRDHILQISPHPFEPGHLLVIGWSGLYRVDESSGGTKLLYSSPTGSRALTVCASRAAGARKLLLGTSRGLFESTETGSRWVRVEFSNNNHGVQGIVESSGPQGAIYLGTDAGVFRKRYDQEDWERRGGGLPPISVSAMVVHPLNGREIWVADQRKGGIYRTGDGGETWRRVDSDMMDARVWSLKFTDDQPRRILAASMGGSVYIGRPVS